MAKRTLTRTSRLVNCLMPRRARALTGSLASSPSLYDDFFLRPTVGLAARILQDEGDSRRGWAVFWHVLDCRLRPRAQFFTRMLQFCLRTAPLKAPDALRAAIREGVPIDEPLFCLFVKACQLAMPALLGDALELYRQVRPPTHNVVCSLAGLCRACRQPQSALFLAADSISNGVAFSEVLLSVLAACCAEASPDGADAAALLLQHIESGHIEHYHCPQIYANLVKPLLAQGRFVPAVGLLRWLTSQDLTPSQHMYGLIINALAKADRIDDAMFVFRTMILNGGSLLPADITVLITACGNSAADEPLQRLYDFATEADRALLDDVIVTNAFITAFSRCGRLDIAYSLFRAFPNPDEVTFNTMIGAFVKADKDTNAISVFRAMIGYGFPAEARMLSGLISCCATLHPVQMLYQYATNIDKAVLANASVVNAFIAAFGRVGRIDIAQHIFEQLVEPRPSTNNAMLSAFVKSRHIAEAMDLFGSLLNRHAPIYPQVLQALVRACGDYSALQPLHMLFVYAKQSGQASLDRPLLVSEFAIAYGRCSDLGSVRSVHEMARQRNLLGDPRVLSAIVSAYTQCGETMTAQSVLEDSCFGNDPDAFASFVTALGHPRRLVDLQRLWKFAEGRCTLLTPAVICAFVDSFARCSCLTSVQLVHQVACDSGMVLADPAILSCITSAFERIGQSST